MNVVIFGSGPMTCEPQFPVLAPGGRTWQITRTVVDALAEVDPPPNVIVFGLESETRSDGPAFIKIPVKCRNGVSPIEITYIPSTIEEFLTLPYLPVFRGIRMPEKVHAVIGCASIQPCATAADFAASRNAALWADLFGDCFTEIQSKAQLHPNEVDANEIRYLHIWKLYLPVLQQADVLSALSERQRFAVMGHLGIAGRLNSKTTNHRFVHTIPYGVFADELPGEERRRLDKANFIVMWSGSFNTWMDPGPLVKGLAQAVRANPRLRLLVMGGKIAGYNEATYNQFVEGIRAEGIEAAVQMGEWRSLAEVRKLYGMCDLGLSIDRFTYEAVLGSRTRIVNFLAAGVPVASTVITELTEELSQKGFILPFQVNDPDDLARVLCDAISCGDALAETGRTGRQYVAERFDAFSLGADLRVWIREPRFAPDRIVEPSVRFSNPLAGFWQKVREQT